MHLKRAACLAGIFCLGMSVGALVGPRAGAEGEVPEYDSTATTAQLRLDSYGAMFEGEASRCFVVAHASSSRRMPGRVVRVAVSRAARI